MLGFKDDFGVSGVYAFLTASAVTTVTTGDEFVPILGTFTNDPFIGFGISADMIASASPTGYYEIDWHATLKSQDAGRVVHVGIAINGETLTPASISVMGIFCKYAAEPLSLSGTLVVELNRGDTIQLQLTSDTDADQVTVDHFTTTIRQFIK